MRRRHFLLTLSAIASGLAARPGAVRAQPTSDLASRLVAVFQRPQSAAAIGRSFLESHPDEMAAGPLCERIAADLRAGGCDPDMADGATLRMAVSRRIRDDFAAGRLAPVRGWGLSLTEARLCGLAALLS